MLTLSVGSASCSEDEPLQGTGQQNRHTQQGDHHADKPQHQTGDIDDPHTNPNEQGQRQNHRNHHDLQQQFQQKYQCPHCYASSQNHSSCS